MSNATAWLLHGVLLGALLATAILTAAGWASAARTSAAAYRAVKAARADVYLASLCAYRSEQREPT
jgi:hypothetical protein